MQRDGRSGLRQPARPIAAHAPLPQGFGLCKRRRCRLLWERCVQRDRRSGFRQPARPIAAHAPLPQGSGKHRRLSAVVGALRAARWAIGVAAVCEAYRGARAAPTGIRALQPPTLSAVVGALRAARWAIGVAATCEAYRGARAAPTRLRQAPAVACCCGSAACNAMGDRDCGNLGGLSRRTRRSHKGTASTGDADCCGSAACSAMGDRDCGNLGGLSRRTRGSHRVPASTGGCQLLWERCVQRDGRSGLRQAEGPILTHAPRRPR